MGIKCLALDFDLTLIEKHTGGKIPPGGVALLAVRQIFKQLVPKAVSAGPSN